MENNSEPGDSMEYSFSGNELDYEEEVSWIEWFCSLKRSEFFIEVDDEYIMDDFNLTGLNEHVIYYDDALDMILDRIDDDFSEDEIGAIESSAQLLYGLIHARYILTSKGMHLLFEKYQAQKYGLCPNVSCNNFPLLPIGLSDLPNVNSCKVYCATCNEVYNPKSVRLSSIDGAFFGTSFAPLFALQYGLVTSKNKSPQYYVPRIYGFAVYRNKRDVLAEEAEGALEDEIEADASEFKKDISGESRSLAHRKGAR
ncbi:putative protein kinase CK2 regulatory subunit CK2B1 [Cryptosporidium canis]|uniref:Casein kinase II subunit beta n=1 Tax=Cryptosporidium canis TaxID=195482 RepID=A0ABQ8P1S3_9CRYT|nr:putative protein kinase CK2 regulatory subunit CK2B1 [Cryptosporidium canis]KAJ1612907.1 putative protein kinase CK2 regulatory subunit CK2B1 [Cryptosporidium canis]